MAYSITTIPSRILPNAPRPAFRFTDDDSVVMSTRASEPRYDSGEEEGFNIDVRDTRANIVARSGDPVGVIAFVTSGDNQYDIMVYDGADWQIYFNS